MACRDLRQRGPRCLEDRQGVFGAAVDGVDETNVSDAVVVVGTQLEVHFLDRRRGYVTARVGELDRRLPVLEHVDGVLGRCQDHLTIVSRELDRIEAALTNCERSEQGSVRLEREFVDGVSVHEQLTCGCFHSGVNAHLDERAWKRRDITGVLLCAGVETRVAREVEGEVESIHIGEIRDVDRECGRPNARGLDEVLGAVIYGQQHNPKPVGLVRQHAQSLESLVGSGTGEYRDIPDIEALKRCPNHLIGASRYRSIPRQNRYGVRVNRRRVRHREQQRPESVTQVGRAHDRESQTEYCDRCQCPPETVERGLLHTASILDLASALERALHQLFSQGRGEGGVVCVEC